MKRSDEKQSGPQFLRGLLASHIDFGAAFTRGRIGHIPIPFSITHCNLALRSLLCRVECIRMPPNRALKDHYGAVPGSVHFLCALMSAIN